MKVEITQKGVYDEKGKAVEVGTEITVKGDKVPSNLLNKCRVVGKPAKAAKAVTNPKKADDERIDLVRSIAKDIADEDFTSEGAPEVGVLNQNLPEGAAKFNAAERDLIWALINED